MPNSGLGPGYVVRGFSRLMHVIGSMPGMKSRVGVGNLEAIRRTGDEAGGQRLGTDNVPLTTTGSNGTQLPFHLAYDSFEAASQRLYHHSSRLRG